MEFKEGHLLLRLPSRPRRDCFLKAVLSGFQETLAAEC
jgi:hypothetical protein